MRFTVLAATLPLIALAACVPAVRAPEPTPAPRPASAPARPAPISLPSDWRDWPLTPGTWRYARDPRDSVATFGRPGGDALVTLRCDLGARRVYLSRSGDTVAALTLRTSSMTRVVPLQPADGTPGQVVAALAPTDSLLDAMGFSRGRFIIEQRGTPPLVLPAWAEIERVTEDCRA